MANNSTVFLVSGDQIDRGLLRRWCKSAGLKAVGFSTAAGFLKAHALSLDDPTAKRATGDVEPFPGAGCLVAEVDLPGASGLQLQQFLRDHRLHLPIVFVSQSTSVATAIEAIRGGAVDFLEKKELNATRFLATVRHALTIDARFRSAHARRNTARRRLALLSPRQHDVLELLVAGHDLKSIAARLGTSYHTVRNQRAAIMQKLAVESAVELIELVRTAEPNRPGSPARGSPIGWRI